MKKLPTGDKLKKRAQELEIGCSGLGIRASDSGEHYAVYEFELQRKEARGV